MRRTRTVRRINYAAAAFYVWVMVALVIVITNVMVKVMALKALGVK